MQVLVPHRRRLLRGRNPAEARVRAGLQKQHVVCELRVVLDDVVQVRAALPPRVGQRLRHKGGLRNSGPLAVDEQPHLEVGQLRLDCGGGVEHARLVLAEVAHHHVLGRGVGEEEA